MKRTNTEKRRKSSVKKWWTPEEMLRDGIYPFGRSHLYRSLKDGSVPSLRVGKKYVIPVNAFNAWLDSCGNTMRQGLA